jgi:site-specific recombinase XerD
MNLEYARRYLLGYFDTNHPMRDFTAGDAEDFRQHLIGQGKNDNTVRRAIGRARQFFRAAMRRGLIQTNPFEGIAAAVRANPSRFYFVSRSEAQKVLDHCPDAQWRLLMIELFT